MSAWQIRELIEDDLDDVLRLWDAANASQVAPGLSVAELVATVRDGHPGVVACIGDELVGTAVAQHTNDRAWVQRVTIAPQWRHQGIATALLSALEAQLAERGVRRFSALVPVGESNSAAQLFEQAGYRTWPAMSYVEKYTPQRPATSTLLEQLGAAHLPEDLWDRIGGMAEVKTIIERRVILPVKESLLAAKVGMQPPKAIVLFGPPGTGKTSFARGVAGRLGWPFVELHTGDVLGQVDAPAQIREFFATTALLDSCVVFIDEVEDVAGRRGESTSHAITNELLRCIPTFRQGASRLLICATNDLSALDPAFRRPGRFDCLIPVGIPDASARAAIWDVYVPEDRSDIDLDALVVASSGFTPADIAHAAQTAAHRGFERALTGAPARLATADYIAVLAETQPSIDEKTLAEFKVQIKEMERW